MTSSIPVKLQRQVRKRFANSCTYCRTAEELTATTFEFEHIVPRSAGGATAFENVCLSCPMCNRYKSDRALLHPLGRVGEIREVVEAVLYLESAAFVTGETLHIDGGAHAGHW